MFSLLNKHNFKKILKHILFKHNLFIIPVQKSPKNAPKVGLRNFTALDLPTYCKFTIVKILLKINPIFLELLKLCVY